MMTPPTKQVSSQINVSFLALYLHFSDRHYKKQSSLINHLIVKEKYQSSLQVISSFV